MVGIAKCALIATCMFIASMTDAAAQSADVGHVTAVDGYVLASTAGRLVRLDVLDSIRDRTKVEVRANSELQLCHHVTHTLVTLRGPASVVVSTDGLTAENAAMVKPSAKPCFVPPKQASVQAGLLTRGISKEP
jgi:hypothetical protein